jgi:hypothetical protein
VSDESKIDTLKNDGDLLGLFARDEKKADSLFSGDEVSADIAETVSVG